MFGNNIKAEIFGESHSEVIGVELTGLPKGLVIDMLALQAFANRRKSVDTTYSTPRKEDDIIIVESGVIDGFTTGTPIRMIIRNTSIKQGDYANLLSTPRPSHADYVAKVKYGEEYNATGGGAFSGRMTAPMVIMGGIAKQLLESQGIQVLAGLSSVGEIECGDFRSLDFRTNTHDFYAIDGSKAVEIRHLFERVRSEKDSVGGTVSCVVRGMPVGVGGAMFDGLEGALALGLYGIPAVKGVEFGAGFALSKMNGSRANDEFYYEKRVKTYTNHNGGINGGISNGMDITMRVAIKPTPSIGITQRTVNLDENTNVELEIKGRHDVCIAPRAVVVVEAVASFVILDRLIGEGKVSWISKN